MSGERALDQLLRTMSPELQDHVFVFCTVPGDADLSALPAPLLLFREREGITLVLRREDAERAGLPHLFASRLITLNVHSALDAVGFLTAITARLAQAGISVNAVSAYHHDHLFVPEHRAEEALACLSALCRAARSA
ncbi:ACT domain-containing protein [Bradyrhizobium sp. HKCCYLR20261]|uniref:ACT domain-containing protein n=1 Tax=Bradyrhizobium sp. HKCCYLR20261 TaxID=3420760 RepID=UPI003EBAD8D9